MSTTKQYVRPGRPPLYPTRGWKVTVHLSDEVHELIMQRSKRDGVNIHAIARNALLRGLTNEDRE